MNLDRIVENITKPDLGHQLQDLLYNKKSLKEISEWAWFFFKKPGMNVEKRDILRRIHSVAYGQEYELMEEEFHMVAQSLINDEENILKRLGEAVQKRMPYVRRPKKKKGIA